MIIKSSSADERKIRYASEFITRERQRALDGPGSIFTVYELRDMGNSPNRAGKTHQMRDILVFKVFAVICAADDWFETEKSSNWYIFP